MIVFLTLCYTGIVFVLSKMKIIRWNLGWKISPLLFFLLICIVFFVPMQWQAPYGTVVVFKPVTEVIPSVSGTITEVAVSANTPVKKGDILFKIGTTKYKASLSEVKANLKLAQTRLLQARKLAEANAGSQYEVEQYTAQVDSLRAKMQRAIKDLKNTIVRAPGDGHVVALTLQSGQRVGNTRSWISFVNESQTKIAVFLQQNAIANVKKGADAEITFKLYPGKIFKASVSSIVLINQEGQIQPSGVIKNPNLQQPPSSYAAVLEIQDEDLENYNILGGARGTAAIYTSNAKMTKIMRQVMLRMDSWINFVSPL